MYTYTYTSSFVAAESAVSPIEFGEGLNTNTFLWVKARILLSRIRTKDKICSRVCQHQHLLTTYTHKHETLHAHTCAQAHAHTYAHTRAHTQTCSQNLPGFSWLIIQICKFIHVYIYIRMYTYTYIHVYAEIYIYT